MRERTTIIALLFLAAALYLAAGVVLTIQGHLRAAPWAWALCLLNTLVALWLRYRRPFRVEERRNLQLVRSPEHQAKVAALGTWLQDVRIVRAIVQSREATAEGLQKTLHDLEAMDEQEVGFTMALILRERVVRQVIANHIVKTQHLPRTQVMAHLRKWADVWPQDRVS